VKKKERDPTDKVPELLLSGPVTEKANYNQYRTWQYRKNRLEKEQPLTFRELKRQLQQALDNWEKALNQNI
jgi:hypothetical protein